MLSLSALLVVAHLTNLFAIYFNWFFIVKNSVLFVYFRWLKSQAKKDGVDVEIAKYDGKSL